MRASWAFAGLLGLTFCAAAAHAQITNPIDLGSSEADNTSSTSLAVTTLANVPAGSSIIVIADSSSDSNGNQRNSAICSDGANTYHTDVSQIGGARDFTTICSTHVIASQLDAGGEITITWTGGSGPWFQRLHAFAVTGLAAAPLDQTATRAGFNFTPSSGATATTVQGNELLFAAITVYDSVSLGANGTANNCASGTPSYTSLGSVGDGAPSLVGMFCIVSTTGAYSANATLGAPGTNLWQLALATYKAPPPPPAPTLGTKALLLLSGGLALAGLIVMRRRLAR